MTGVVVDLPADEVEGQILPWVRPPTSTCIKRRLDKMISFNVEPEVLLSDMLWSGIRPVDAHLHRLQGEVLRLDVEGCAVPFDE